MYEPFNPSSLSDINPAMATVAPGETNRVNLILSPNILDPKLSYIFRLTATNDVGSNCAEITVKADAPPISATIVTTPTSGVAVETEFDLTVSGALDIFPDSPFLYQFGIVKGVGPTPNIQWISAVQASPSFNTILPKGNEERSFEIDVLARVFDRKGGYSDVTSPVSVLPNPEISDDFYSDRFSRLQDDLVASRDWSSAVSKLVAYLTEINNTSLPSQDLKRQGLLIFLGIFDAYLPASSQHYLTAASIFSLLTSNQGIEQAMLQREISQRLYSVAEWFKIATAIVPSLLSVPTQASGQPLFLRSSYPVPEREVLSSRDAAVLLSPWRNMLESVPGDLQVAERFVMATEVLSNVLCQQSSTGEEPSFVDTSFVDLYAMAAAPSGLVEISGHLVHFGSSVTDIYQSNACRGEGVACSETCIAGIVFPSDLSQQGSEVMQTLQLSSDTRQKITNEIEGSSPTEIQLFSEIISVSLSIPSEDVYLTVQDLDNPIQILLPVTLPLPNNESILLCLYREVGGASGYDNYEWLLDDTSSPSILEVDSREYYTCEFSHLSEFAIGLLPPPVITDPPPTSAPTTPPTIATRPTTPTTRPTTPPPVVMQPVSSPAGAIAAVLIILLLIVLVSIFIVIVFLTWRKKKRKLQIAPDESTKATGEEKPAAQLLRAEPLTPAESKLLMDIIQCLEEGKRTRVGKMNVLPSIRLRELRFEIVDNFPGLKNKPFYFLTRQLCDIDPTTEQQQFVSIVFGDKPIFIREVTADNLQTKKHFCVCGNAAQFECSNCSLQGYCSESCQHSHWADRHQKECGRLSERRRRSDVLYNRQNTSAPFALALSPISETPQRGPLGPASETATTPTNWKSFMGQKKAPSAVFPPRTRALSVPAKDVTTLGSLAKRLSVPNQTPGLSPGPQTDPNLGPLKRLSAPTAFTFPQASGEQQRPSVSRLSSTIGPLSPITPVPAQTSTETRSQLQSPLQSTPHHTFFTARPQPRGVVAAPPPARQLSIQSVGSADFAMSPQPMSPIAAEPLLESDEDDYDTTDSDSDGVRGDLKHSGASSGSRPPSLAVRRRESRVSSSSSEEESSSEDETKTFP